MQIRHWSIREMLFGMKKQKRTEKLIHIYIHMFNAIQKSMTITKNNLLPQNKKWQGERKGKSKFLPALSLVICNRFFFLLSFSSNNYIFWIFFPCVAATMLMLKWVIFPCCVCSCSVISPVLADGCLPFRRCSTSVVAGRRYLWGPRV